MKKSDFIKEDPVVVAKKTVTGEQIHMAREECYNAANNAIQLHKLLKELDAAKGLDAWAAEKITLADDYLRTVREWLTYEIKSAGAIHEDADGGITSSVNIAAAPPQNLLGKKKIIKRTAK